MGLTVCWAAACDTCIVMQEIQRPTVLAGEVRRLVSLVHHIAPLMGLHASVLVREALLSCACSAPAPCSAQCSPQNAQVASRPDSQQGSRSDKPQEGQQQATNPLSVMPSIAEWYMTTVVKDHRNLGVSISKARCVQSTCRYPMPYCITAQGLQLIAAPGT